MERPYISTFFNFGEWQSRTEVVGFTDLDLYSDANGWAFLYTPDDYTHVTNGRAQLCMFFQERRYRKID